MQRVLRGVKDTTEAEVALFWSPEPSWMWGLYITLEDRTHRIGFLIMFNSVTERAAEPGMKNR